MRSSLLSCCSSKKGSSQWNAAWAMVGVSGVGGRGRNGSEGGVGGWGGCGGGGGGGGMGGKGALKGRRQGNLRCLRLAPLHGAHRRAAGHGLQARCLRTLHAFF